MFVKANDYDHLNKNPVKSSNMCLDLTKLSIYFRDDWATLFSTRE